MLGLGRVSVNQKGKGEDQGYKHCCRIEASMERRWCTNSDSIRREWKKTHYVGEKNVREAAVLWHMEVHC